MWRTALRNVAGRKLRLVATALAVTLGVAFMAGTLVLTDTISRTFDGLFADAYEGTDAVVRATASFESPDGFAERGRIDAGLVDVLAAVDGVAAVEANVFGYAQVVDRWGDPVGNPQMGAPTIGGSWGLVDELNPFTLVAGTPPQSDDEVVLDEATAEEAGYAVGDTATVLVRGGPRAVTVSGLARFGDAGQLGGASFVLFTPQAAQALVAEPGRVDEISLVAGDGLSPQQLVERLGAVLPDGVEAVTGATITEENQDAAAGALSFFNTFMLVFAAIALLVGGFMIFNAFSITVLQRTRENGLLRALGASRRQVLLGVVLEALVVGAVASLAGLAAGVGFAALLKALLHGFGVAIPATGLVLTSGTVVVSLLAGLAVTVAASISPARKAAKVAPIAAMRVGGVGSTGYGSLQRVVVGGLLTLGGVVAVLVGVSGSVPNALPLVGAGSLLVFFGVSTLGRTIALPLSRAIGWPLPRLRGIAGELARENAMRNPKRTATTASALMIGVGVVVFISIFASSTKASFADAVDRSFSGDLVLTHPGGMDPSLTARVGELPEVEAAVGVRLGAAELDDGTTFVVAADPTALGAVLDLVPVRGSLEDLAAAGEHGIAVVERVADEHGLDVGDRVPARFPSSGPVELTVAMVYEQNLPEGDWLVSLDAQEAFYADQFDQQVFVKAAEGVEVGEALAAVEAVAASYPGVEVLDQDSYVADRMAVVDQLLGLVYALLALAILIAVLGIGNTLALSIVERARELGVLRAVGMTRGQLRSTIRWESVVIALQGTVLGLVVGVFFGWAMLRALRDQGLTTFDLPVTRLAVVVVLAGLAGVVAAVLPARRASRLQVLEAISSE